MKKVNIYRPFLIVCSLLVSQYILAQMRVLKGNVEDANTLQPIVSASISFAGLNKGTTSNAYGRFNVTVPQNLPGVKMVISALSYLNDTIPIIYGRNYYAILLQPSKNFLDEIIVTGVSRATLERENPAPVIAVSAKEIEHATESNIIDVLVKNVPGLSAVKTGPNISKPFIRGLGYSRVLTLYDGIRQEGQQWGDEHGIEVDDYNIEKAEVIKGPASLMYGSDAVAGVVSLLTAMPHENDSKFHGRLFSEYQGNNHLSGNSFRLTYANVHWAYALRGSYRIAGNYINNIDGKVYNTGFRETNASATIKHTGNNGHSDLNVTLYNNLQGIPDGSRDSLTRDFTKQVYEGIFDDVKHRLVVSDNELNSYRLSPLHQRIQHYRIYSNNHYQLDNGAIDFLLAFQQNIRREYDHPTEPQQAGLYVRLNTLNYGFRYNAPEILNTYITVGINGMYQDNKSKDATDFPIPDYKLFDAGGFIYAKWKQNNWTITGGIRYDIRNLKGSDLYTVTDSTTMFSERVFSSATAGTNLQFPSFDKTFTGTSFSLGITFKINKFISLKANMAKGYRTPNITEFAANGLDPGAHIIYLGNRNFVPEFSMQGDIGAEVNSTNLYASVSVFNNHIQNYIYLSQLTDANGNAITNTQGDKTYQYQQATAQLYGLEASMSFHPERIKGFSYNSAFSLIYGYNRSAIYKNKGAYGEYLSLIPPPKLLSSLSQEVQTKSKLIPLFTVKTEMEYNATQNRYLALNNTETATPFYTIFNFSVNGRINYRGSQHFELRLQVNNFFDKAYQSNMSRLKYFEYYSASPNGHTGIFNMGRNICFKAIFSF
ncbi:MAG: TonB-dependent receptor [Ginsengibacter sp.]